MSIEIITVLLFVALILGLTSGLPVAFVMGGVAMLFTVVLWGPLGLYLSAWAAFGSMSSFILIAIPMFIFMAFVLQKSGVAEALYGAMHLWAGRLNGGLAIGTIVVCTLIAAMVGGIGAGIITAGIIALPEMLKYGYDKRLCYGSIMAGGCLGTLIPPSIHMIIYASIARQSVGMMLIGGFFPGLILSALYMTYIGIRTALNPSLGPGLPPEARGSWGQKLVAVRSLVLPIILIVSVLGSIFWGIATPTEAAAVGCVGAIICAAVHRRLTWGLLKETAYETIKLFGMLMWIIVGASCFSRFYIAMGAAGLLESLVFGAEVNPWFILAMMQLTLIGLGMIIEDVAIIMIAGPIFTPIIVGLGFDPVWFGVVFIVNMQIALMSPPYGFANFYLKGVVPEERIAVLYRSTFPFIGLQVVGLVLIMAFPQIVLWLPSLMIK